MFRVLAKIADEPDVSVDWLLGRSERMELPKTSGQSGVLKGSSFDFAGHRETSLGGT